MSDTDLDEEKLESVETDANSKSTPAGETIAESLELTPPGEPVAASSETTPPPVEPVAEASESTPSGPENQDSVSLAESTDDKHSTLPADTDVAVQEPLTEEQIKELYLQLKDNTPGPPAPTESYVHPVTGREVYVPKPHKQLGPGATIYILGLLMFVGGSLATLMMVARAFELHGDLLVGFVIGSCTVVLGLAGGLALRNFGNNFSIGAIIGGCFGALGGLLIYAQTSHHSWWH